MVRRQKFSQYLRFPIIYTEIHSWGNSYNKRTLSVSVMRLPMILMFMFCSACRYCATPMISFVFIAAQGTHIYLFERGVFFAKKFVQDKFPKYLN